MAWPFLWTTAAHAHRSGLLDVRVADLHRRRYLHTGGQVPENFFRRHDEETAQARQHRRLDGNAATLLRRLMDAGKRRTRRVLHRRSEWRALRHWLQAIAAHDGSTGRERHAARESLRRPQGTAAPETARGGHGPYG